MKDIYVDQINEFTWHVAVDSRVRYIMTRWSCKQLAVDTVTYDIKSNEFLDISFSIRTTVEEKQEFMRGFEEQLIIELNKIGHEVTELDKGDILLNEEK